MALSVVVVGGTGNVGRGIVAAALGRGWDVTVVDHDDSRFAALADELGGATTVVGSVADGEQATALATGLDLLSVDAVVLAVNVPFTPGPLLSTSWPDAAQHLDAYLRLHLSAVSAFVPLLKPGAVLVGMGGGMADIPAKGMGVVSMAQAAARMLYRHAEREARSSDVIVREVLIRAMVHGFGDAGEPGPGMLGADEIGRRVCEVIESAREAEVVVVLEPAPAA
jgi:NAD(P)-dependent dehydrogenase (short-subunit alcohol dehydrogenase family)